MGKEASPVEFGPVLPDYSNLQARENGQRQKASPVEREIGSKASNRSTLPF